MAIDESHADRRGVMAGGTALLAGGGMAQAAAGRGAVKLIVGTYAKEGGGGLYPVAYHPADGRWQVGAPVAAVNASFGVRSARRGGYYLLEEAAAGQVALWDAAGGWHRTARFATMGADPCHAALDARETCLAIANYSSGSVISYRIDARSGAPVGTPTIRAGTGQGPDAARQAGPHAHWVGFSPDGRWLHSVDLGADRVLSFPFDSRTGTIGAATTGYRAAAGSGPRHLAFHPRQARAYLVSELVNRVTVLAPAGDGRFAAVQSLSSLPDGYAGPSQAAHIAIDRAGRTLYVSNRGHDSIAVYAVGADGRIALRQIVPTGGSWPRFFLLVEEAKRLVVANEHAGELRAFAIGRDGALSSIGGAAKVPGAVFIGRG